MTVLSNDGQSWLTKLERIGEKSACNKQQIFNNLGHLLNSDMLKGQFQRLDGNKSVGIDRVTKAAYDEHLDDNINNLIKRIRRRAYYPKAARITEIPKEDGSKRPLAISCIEDKLVQLATSDILIDEWFDEISQSVIHGRAEMVRYADDMVFTFQYPSEAKRFYKVLPKRLNKYGLELHDEKSQLISAGHVAAMKANQSGKRLPTFNFLGFTGYWGRTRKGYWRLKFTSRKDRFAAKLKGLRDFLWKNLNANRRQTLNTVIRVVRGWINYHGISDNQRRVGQFIHQSRRIIYRWFNRKGGRHPLTWVKLDLILKMLGYPAKWKTRSMFDSR